MKIHGHPMSTCTRKVLCTLAEKGHKAEMVVVDFAKGEHKQADHLTIQPFGQIPVLDDDGFVFYESRAIMRYLDEKLSGPKLHGADLKSRATIEQWISIETSNFTPHAMKIIRGALLGPMFGKPVDEEMVKAGREGVTTTAEIMDRQLGKKQYIAGDSFSLADICYLPYIEYIYACKNGDVFDKFTNVTAWWKRTSERPSWQTAIGK